MGDEKAVIEYMVLDFICEEGKFTYYISIGFHSAENKVKGDNVNIEITLSDEDVNEFVAIIIRAIMKKFFNR